MSVAAWTILGVVCWPIGVILTAWMERWCASAWHYPEWSQGFSSWDQEEKFWFCVLWPVALVVFAVAVVVGYLRRLLP